MQQMQANDTGKIWGNDINLQILNLVSDNFCSNRVNNSKTKSCLVSYVIILLERALFILKIIEKPNLISDPEKHSVLKIERLVTFSRERPRINF